MVISLSSCKKEDNSGMIKDGPSPSLAKKGTIVPDSVTCVEEVNQFVGLFKAFRAKQHPSIPVYYDRHLIDLMSGESGITSSVANTINSEYYVIDKGEKKWEDLFHLLVR